MYSQQVGKYLRMCKLMIFSFILDLSSILKSKCNFLNIKIAIQRLVENTIFVIPNFVHLNYNLYGICELKPA